MWEDRLQELLAFRASEGHVNVPKGWPNNRGLANWVMNQRRLIRTGAISPERGRRFQELGIAWPCAEDRAGEQERRWRQMCDALDDYRREHGHVDVPGDGVPNPKLGRWLVRQRHLLRKGLLTPERRRRLEDLGVEDRERGRSRDRDREWGRMVDALAAYRRDHGDCQVPQDWPENPRLARWVIRQRHQLKRNSVRPDRRARLLDLGLSPPLPPAPAAKRSLRDREWESCFALLVAFKALHGHCNVPRRCAENPRLGRWVSHQRHLEDRELLDADRHRRLDRLGLEWTGRRSLERHRDAFWERLFQRLAAYRRDHGTCDVPARWPPDPALGRWVSSQRCLRRAGKLNAERLRRLDALGLRWSTPSTRRVRVPI